jgi:hypothetical protein
MWSRDYWLTWSRSDTIALTAFFVGLLFLAPIVARWIFN